MFHKALQKEVLGMNIVEWKYEKMELVKKEL